jgi:hypothetical protein
MTTYTVIPQRVSNLVMTSEKPELFKPSKKPTNTLDFSSPKAFMVLGRTIKHSKVFTSDLRRDYGKKRHMGCKTRR